MVRNSLSTNFNQVANLQHDSVFSDDSLINLYEEISPALSPKQREYLYNLKEGNIEPDMLTHMEILAHLVTIYGMHVIKWSLQSGAVTKDIGSVLSEARQGNMAAETMRLKRKESDGDDESGVVGPPPKSAFALLQGLD